MTEMTEVTLRKLSTHYLLPPEELAEQRKLDRLQLEVLDQAFELAIDRAGLPKDGELCLRSVSVGVRLRLDSTEQSISAHWTETLAQSLCEAIRNAPKSERVFYYSRRQAVFDLALSVARGDYERVWAWCLLGLWEGNEAVDPGNAVRQLVRVLSRELQLIVPVLRLVASAGYLPSLSRKLSTTDWRELAEMALINAGLFIPSEAANEPSSSRAFSYALRILKRSQIAAAIVSSGTLATADDGTRRLVATLVVLDVEPALLYSQSASGVTAVLAASLTGDKAQIRSTQHKTEVLAPHETGSVGGEEITQTSLEMSPSEQAVRRVRSDVNPPSSIAQAKLDRQAGLADASDDTASGLEAETDSRENAILDPRQRGRTDFGGLLFLLNVIPLLKLPDQILDDPSLRARPLAWSFHQLALSLAPVGPADAAALAFAGLPPRATPPSEQEPPANENEATSIRNFTAQIVECLSSLLNDEYESPRAMLDFVCRREAEIVADPAWLEVRFSLDEVSTEVRRIGLDLDPGYLSWLGVVVKFVYE
jgi:hypothetical protein